MPLDSLSITWLHCVQILTSVKALMRGTALLHLSNMLFSGLSACTSALISRFHLSPFCQCSGSISLLFLKLLVSAVSFCSSPKIFLAVFPFIFCGPFHELRLSSCGPECVFEVYWPVHLKQTWNHMPDGNKIKKIVRIYKIGQSK